MIERSGNRKEQALVLKTIRHGETSRIATLFGQNSGKIAVLAKGARSGKSGASGGALDAPSLIEAVIHFKPSRSVQLLGQTAVAETYSGLKNDVARTAYAAVVCELVLKGFTDDEANARAFDATSIALKNLDGSVLPGKYVLIYFLLELAEALGFAVDPFNCPICGCSTDRAGIVNRFVLDAGAICCVKCECPGYETQKISGESAGVLRLFKRGNVNFERIKVSKPAQNELISLLISHLRFHHTSFHHLPSLGILNQLASD